VAYVVLTGLLLTFWRDRTRGSFLPLISAVAAGWAMMLAYYSTQFGVPVSRVLLVEMANDSAWLIFLSSLLGGAVATQSNWLVRHGGIVLGLGLLIVSLLFEFAGLQRFFPDAVLSVLVMGSIATALYALVGIEQLYRNARPSQQNGLKFLCLGLAGIFAFDLFLYTNAVVEGQIPALFWSARGFVVALCVPLLAVSVKRVTTWKRGIFASRQVIFYTTTLFAAGIYLSLIGLMGYLIQAFGMDWSETLQLVFFSAAVLAFFALLLSDQLRARIRVFLAKHFFERKYDYRVEWLRLIHTLTTEEDKLPLKKRAVKAVAQIVDSPSGNIWLRSEDGSSFRCVAAWDMRPHSAELAASGNLAKLLVTRGWVIDIAEVASAPNKYQPLTVNDIPEELTSAAYLVPLVHEVELIGFVSLSKPKTPFTLNFEDHDLLKTVGQQIASYLTQEEATERLAESRQFEAFNRFTAFIMHDLKNAIAQQSLVVTNAEKHKRNPEFIDDAIETIKGSVERMRRVLTHLRQSALETPHEVLDLAHVAALVTSRCSDRQPVPFVTGSEESLFVSANKDRLVAAVTHAVRNAQDACESDGKVSIDIRSKDRRCEIEISDDGCGMDKEFISDRLFRPFDSTKGAEGMGIGAYQIRETLRASGGDVEVSSEVGKGTTLLMHLPMIDRGQDR
jgi:putative PEP-CTERM system histidine kinase